MIMKNLINLKKIKALFAVSIISGALLSSLAFADIGWTTPFQQCQQSCAGMCNIDGVCFQIRK